MSAAIDAELRLRLRDGATAGVRAASQAAQQEAARAATASERAARRAVDAAQRAAQQQRTSYERLSQAREMLGVRPERVIQREIQQTEAAYNRLARSGTLSWQQQAVAADRMRQRVRDLTNEMGRLTTAQRAYSSLKFGAAGVAGVAAAGYVLKGPAEQAMSYDRRLSHMANTAYYERDKAGREIGRKTLEEAVNRARREGGGTRDQAAGALDTMIASGTVSNSEAIQMLPGIMKASIAADTDASALATIAIRAKQSFKIKAEDLPAILSAAMVAGQAGGFELKNMAKWLPQQMAMGGNLGMSGKDGFAKLTAWNQAAMITSGGKDEAGNNLRDLLNELNTPHFKKFLGDQLLGNGTPGKRGERYKRAKDIDAIYLDYQSRGIDKVSATLELAEKVFAKDKNYQALQAKLRATAKDDKGGQREIIAAMAAQTQGSAIGKIFHNQQSLMAFLGLMNNQQYTQEVLKKVRGQYSAPEDKSEISTSHAVISKTADYKVEHAKGDVEAAQKAVMDSLTPAIGKAAAAFSDLAVKYPLMVGTTVTATAALAALAGAAGLTALAMGGRLPGVSLPSAGAALGAATRFGAAGFAGAVGYGAGTLLYDHALAGNAAGNMIGRGAARVASFFGSKEADDALRAEHQAERASASPGKYTPPRGAGERLGSGTALLSSQDFALISDRLKPVEQKPVDVNFRGQLGLAPGLVLQSQSMQASGGSVQMNTGNLMTGAP